MTKLFLYAVI